MWRGNKPKGAVLALVLAAMVLLMISGAAVIRLGQGRLLEAARLKSREMAFSAAEAAYEKALFWMTQQPDMLSALTSAETQGSVNFANSQGNYQISFSNFLGSRPVYRIQATGVCGIYEHQINAYLVQAVSGWDLGTSRVPTSPTQLAQGYFVTGEVVDMPLHINDQKDSPDARDIGISGSPQFLKTVSMGENRYTSGGSDKYSGVMNLFQGGIYFNQPASRIATTEFVQQKIDRFKSFTNPTYQFKPKIVQNLPKHSAGKTGFYSTTVSELPAAHLKFYVKDGKGYLRVYNDCTVAGYTRDGAANNSWDYCLNDKPGSPYKKYAIYGCHYSSGSYTDIQIDDPSSPIYVKQTYGGVESQPGAQIYVDGNVVIGCSQEDMATLGSEINRVKGQIYVVATGNIWIAGELKVAGARDASQMPADNNPNVLGLLAKGVIKVVDPGMTENGLLSNVSEFKPTDISGYMPIGLKDKAPLYSRKLPQTLEVEAALTIGGGGWGAENLYRSSSFPGRKNFQAGVKDTLILRGTRTEPMIGLTASGNNGFLEKDYFDKRMINGILPANIWLKGKYVLIPGGWIESDTIQQN